jgi:amino acid permease
VNHFTARSALFTLWERFGGKKSSEEVTTFEGSLFWSEVSVFSGIMIVLACMLTSLDVVLDIMSATCAMAVMFFIPGLFLIKGKMSASWQVLAWSMIAVGASLAVVSTGDTIVKLSEGNA